MPLKSDYFPLWHSMQSDWKKPVIPYEIATIMSGKPFTDNEAPIVYVVHPLTTGSGSIHPMIKDWYPTSARPGDKVMAYGDPA